MESLVVPVKMSMMWLKALFKEFVKVKSSSEYMFGKFPAECKIIQTFLE